MAKELTEVAPKAAEIPTELTDLTVIKEGLAAAQAKLTAAETRLDALEDVINDLLAWKESLTKPAPAAAAPGLKGDTFKVSGKMYRMRFPTFVHGDRTVTEEDLLSDVALQKELVASESKVLMAV